MKLFSNTIFLLSVLTYVLAGTVPVWTCLKENTLHISKICDTSDEPVDSCCGNKSDDKNNLDPTCCEKFNDLSATVYNQFFDQKYELDQSQILAFHLFDDLLFIGDSKTQVHYSNAPPRTSPPIPLFKLYCSYIC
jgi:hypothetical protein